MKVKIVLKEAKSILQRHKSPAYDQILKQKSENKKKMLRFVLKMAVSTMPLINDAKTINARSNWNIDDNEMTRSAQRILTKSEEDQLLSQK